MNRGSLGYLVVVVRQKLVGQAILFRRWGFGGVRRFGVRELTIVHVTGFDDSGAWSVY